MSTKGLLIWSGGLDSTSLLFHLREKGMEIQTIHFSYGSKHNSQEALAVARIAKEYNVPVIFIDLGWMSKIFVSSLLRNGAPIPHGQYDDRNVKQTVVPFRNGILLSIAAGIAESMEIESVFYAAHTGDHAIYPDCTPSFIEGMGNAITWGTANAVRLFAPWAGLDKADVVQKGNKVGAPLGWTYTCYEGGIRHCGECCACTERKKAFRIAGVSDPTVYNRSKKPTAQNIDVGGIKGQEGFGKF